MLVLRSDGPDNFTGGWRFVAQGPVLVAIAVLLDPLDVPGDLTFVVLAVGGVMGSFACGWAAVRLAAGDRVGGGAETGHPGGAWPPGAEALPDPDQCRWTALA